MKNKNNFAFIGMVTIITIFATDGFVAYGDDEDSQSVLLNSAIALEDNTAVGGTLKTETTENIGTNVTSETDTNKTTIDGSIKVNVFDDWGPNNYLTLITVILMAIGTGLALIQWKTSEKLKRAKYLEEILFRLRFDPEMAKILYILDYDHNWYNRNFHNNKNIDNDFEFKIDKALGYFDYICYSYKLGFLKNDEFKIIRYRVDRICISPSTQRYLWNLYHFSKRTRSECSFIHVIEYGIKNKIIKDDFFDSNSALYKDYKYLNF